MYIPEKDTILNEVLAAFDFPATLVGAVRYGQGHINDTFCVLCQPRKVTASASSCRGCPRRHFPARRN